MSSRRRNTFTSLAALSLSCATIVACGAAPTGNPEPTAAKPGQITRTIVHLYPDGTKDVKRDVITVEEQKQEKALHAELIKKGAIGKATPALDGQGLGVTRQAISVDSSCAYTSMWMFTGTNYSGDEICYYGTGTADLRNDWYMWVYLNGTFFKVNFSPYSWMSGTDGGRLSGDTSLWCIGDVCPTFNAWQNNSNTTTCAKNAYALELGSTYCAPPTLVSSGVNGAMYAELTGAHYTPNSVVWADWYRTSDNWHYSHVGYMSDSSGAISGIGDPDPPGINGSSLPVELDCYDAGCSCSMKVRTTDEATGYQSGWVTVNGCWY